MRILVADAFPDASLSELAEHGHECDYRPGATAETLPARLTGRDVLVVRSTRVNAEALDAAPTLRLVVRAGSGTNTIDCAAAARRGVYVCNAPGCNAVAVAELTCALLLALDRRVADGVADLRASHWDKDRYARAHGIFGRTVGVVGLGHVGLAFAERAAAFGTTVHAVAKQGRSTETIERAREIGVRFVDGLPTLAATCDVLSFHVPATPDTLHMINRELLARVRPGTIILNTARGELVDEDALIEAMDEKGVRAGLDVFADEPTAGSGSIDSRLARHPNVYGTHHIGASTEQAQHAVAAEVVRVIDTFDGGSDERAVPHCVNLDARPGRFVAALHSGGSR